MVFDKLKQITEYIIRPYINKELYIFIFLVSYHAKSILIILDNFCIQYTYTAIICSEVSFLLS